MQWKERPRDWMWDGDPDRINAEVRAHMGRRDLRQDTVAAILGIPRQALARRLRGETKWRWSELTKLAIAWDILATDLAGESPANYTTDIGPSETTIAAYERLFLTKPLPSGDNPLHG